MNMLLPTLIEEFQEKITGHVIEREAKFPDVPNKIMVALGMRRVGKSSFLLSKIKQLLAQGQISLNRILYIDFEDDRLGFLTAQQLSELLDGFYALYPENHDQLCYLFLDEIQNIEGWSTVMRRYLNTKKMKIYLTGSSAKLLSKEIATSLRGRSMATEIWPFSFTEYLKAKELVLPRTYGQKNLDKLKSWLKTYIKEGGFPEVILSDREIGEQRYILQDYVNSVVLRDIVERYRITNITLIRYMVKFLLKHVGCGFSVNTLFNDLKSQGIAVSKTTVHDYLGHIEDAYLAFAVPLYSESLRKTHSNPRKIYAIDTGLVNACTFGFSENIGHQFENLIYLDLRRAGHEIYYYLTATRKEVDFFTQDRQGKRHLFQVCWNMDDVNTQERELRALDEAEKELKIKGQCVTPETYFTSFLLGIRHG